MVRKLTLVQNAYDMCSDQQKKLIDAYLSDEVKFDAKKAMEIAGYAKYADKRSSQSPFKSPRVIRAINERLSPILDKSGITIDEHLKYVASIAYGDPRELVDVRRTNCRYCHGIGHNYQWTHAEYKALLDQKVSNFKKQFGDKVDSMTVTVEELVALGMELPDDSGGYGFDEWRDPNYECIECHGNGIAKVYIQESFMNHPLYAGAKVDKNGQIEILMKNQNDALKQISQLQGFIINKEEVEHTITAETLSVRRAKATARRDAKNGKK